MGEPCFTRGETQTWLILVNVMCLEDIATHKEATNMGILSYNHDSSDARPFYGKKWSDFGGTRGGILSHVYMH